MIEEVEAFIFEKEANQQAIMLYLHDLLMAQPHMTCKIRYRVPFYYRKSWICYLNPKKGDRIELCFLRGNELSNEQGILDFKDRTQVCGIEWGTLAEIQEEALHEIIQEALILDDTVKYVPPNRRKKP